MKVYCTPQIDLTDFLTEDVMLSSVSTDFIDMEGLFGSQGGLNDEN